jgi:hypothetical protein
LATQTEALERQGKVMLAAAQVRQEAIQVRVAEEAQALWVVVVLHIKAVTAAQDCHLQLRGHLLL